jgi:hypothetical protein
MPVTCLEELPECRLGQLGPLLVTVWYEARAERALEAIQRGFASVNAQHPKVTIASVVRGGRLATRPMPWASSSRPSVWPRQTVAAASCTWWFR